MPSKSFSLDDGLVFTVYKRRGNRHLRLSISAAGKVRVSIPAWAPYKAGIDFARSRQSWLLAQREQPVVLRSGQAIGKGHHLIFQTGSESSKVTTRITGTTIMVTYPMTMSVSAEPVQLAAHKAALRSLRRQAEQLLPQRLATLAERHGFTYGSVRIKQLTGRWGSCDQHQRIVLSLFLMQLPWQLIDYVLLHELTHTRVLKHGTPFWQAMEAVLPEAKTERRKLQAYRPVLAHQPI
jgi:predicted metal-dependent hydrolase